MTYHWQPIATLPECVLVDVLTLSGHMVRGKRPRARAEIAGTLGSVDEELGWSLPLARLRAWRMARTITVTDHAIARYLERVEGCQRPEVTDVVRGWPPVVEGPTKNSRRRRIETQMRMDVGETRWRLAARRIQAALVARNADLRWPKARVIQTDIGGVLLERATVITVHGSAAARWAVKAEARP